MQYNNLEFEKIDFDGELVHDESSFHANLVHGISDIVYKSTPLKVKEIEDNLLTLQFQDDNFLKFTIELEKQVLLLVRAKGDNYIGVRLNDDKLLELFASNIDNSLDGPTLSVLLSDNLEIKDKNGELLDIDGLGINNEIEVTIGAKWVEFHPNFFILRQEVREINIINYLSPLTECLFE